MKKITFWFVLVVAFVLTGSIYYVANNLDDLIKTAIEEHGSKATQTSVRVDNVKLNLSDGSGAISGLSVANTSDFSIPHAFSLGEIRLGVDLTTLQKEPYVISEVTVLAPQVFVEINKDNKTNLNELKNNLPVGKASSSEDTSTTQTKTNEPRLIIRKLTFAEGNILAKFVALGDKEHNLKLPNISMSNLGGANGATASELASEILKRLTSHASDVVKEKLIDVKLDELKAKAKAKIDTKKAELKAKADVVKARQKQKAKDKLKGLFGK